MQLDSAEAPAYQLPFRCTMAMEFFGAQVKKNIREFEDVTNPERFAGMIPMFKMKYENEGGTFFKKSSLACFLWVFGSPTFF